MHIYSLFSLYFLCVYLLFMYESLYLSGTIASTLVYFRLERPSVVKKQLSRRHSTVVIQVTMVLQLFAAVSGCDQLVVGPTHACTW